MRKADLFSGLGLIGVFSALSSASAYPPDDQARPPRHDQKLFLQCRLDALEKPIAVEVGLELPSQATETELDQRVELPAPLAPIRVTRYFPRAVCEQSFAPVDGTGADPAIELSINGPAQSFQNWLVGNDAARNRLISLIGKWRYMAVADKGQRDGLFTHFQQELNRAPTLSISRADGSGLHNLPAKPDTVRALDDLECRIQVRSFYPHFHLDRGTNTPANLSDRRLNPAALVEIEHGGRKETRWIFARFPGFRPDKSERLPLRITLDCPAEPRGTTPDFALVTVGGTSHELWEHRGAESVSRPLAVDERVEVPGSRYTFHISQFVPSGRLIEEYRPADGALSVSALQIEAIDASGEKSVIWLEMGKPRIISTARGPMAVVFGPRPAESHGVHE